MVKRIQHEGRDRLIGVTKSLAKSQVKVGYFKEDGIHQDSGMSYASLMYLQEYKGVRSKNGLIRRRAFEITSRMHSRRLIAQLNKKIKFAYLLNLRNPEHSIGYFGKEMVKEIKHVFGSGMLPDNAEVTQRLKGRNEPLVDTGELRDKLHYKIVQK